MIQFTTPTIVLRVPLDIHEAKILVTLQQGTRKLEKEIGSDDVSVQAGDTIIKARLTQEETGVLKAGSPTRVQANWIYSDGTRNATKFKQIEVLENLHNEVITYE